MSAQYFDIAMSPEVEEAVKEWHYQQARIAYCEQIIASKPNTGAARNAQRLIDDIREQLGYQSCPTN